MTLVDSLDQAIRWEVTSRLVLMVVANGAMSLDEIERIVESARKDAATCAFTFHGGYYDGQTMDLSPDIGDEIGLAAPDRPTSREEVDEALMLGRKIDIAFSRYVYRRRQNTDPPRPGGSAVYDLDRVEPEPTAS